MILTQRDKEILSDLHRYSLHTTRGIAARHFPGVAMTTVLRRLRALEEGGLVQRLTGLEGGANAWALTKMGAYVFAPAASKIHFPRFILDHDLKLAALRLRLEEVGIAHSWRPEHEIRARVARKFGLDGTKERNVPDGLMATKIGDKSETVAVELELSNKNQDRYRRIFRDYATKNSLWGFWYVVGNAVIGRQLVQAAKSSWHGNQRPYFVWSVLEEVMDDPARATARTVKQEFRIGNLWKPNEEKPAHPPAHPMSTLEIEIGTTNSGLTLDDETQIRVP